MLPVVVRPWVEVDSFAAVGNSRAILGDVLHDLNNDLPRNLAYYQTNRCLPKNPGCFWYVRTYSLDPRIPNFRQLHFVVKDSDSSTLEVIWVVVLPKP